MATNYANLVTTVKISLQCKDTANGVHHNLAFITDGNFVIQIC